MPPQRRMVTRSKRSRSKKRRFELVDQSLSPWELLVDSGYWIVDTVFQNKRTTINHRFNSFIIQRVQHVYMIRYNDETVLSLRGE